MKRNANCPCGSGLLAKECCYPTKPPINMPVPQYVKLDNVPVATRVNGLVDDSMREQIESHLSQMFNLTVKIGSESGPGFLPREQANRQIAHVLGYGLDEYHLDKERNEHTLIGPLHSVKYHQQQCMYRLFVLQQRSKKSKQNSLSHPSNNKHINVVHTIQFEDLPLRAEFEAFVSRISSALVQRFLYNVIFNPVVAS
ncbi:SEC-C domain-containing protein [Alicyclobacillus dauci]|uniref:SEC-C domain-containing protein n=1 Tax=Alicyclobacillus dauci TaxID=1475485 RepID=UPI003898FBA0